MYHLFFRFLPDGSYLNANEHTPNETAHMMNEIIKDKQKYYDFMKFHRYYTYHASAESVDTDPLCSFCVFVNDESKRKQRRVYARFTEWWYGSNQTGDIVVHYSYNQTANKTCIKGCKATRPTVLEPTDEDEPPAMNAFSDIAVKLFRRYFD